MNSLYSLAHDLLNMGMDGSPIYSDNFARLNREVYEQALNMYNTPSGDTAEEEAELCLSLLVAFNATFCDDGRKQQYIQHILDRCFEVLPQLSPSLLKVRLLTYCYGEVYEAELAQEAHAIIESWDASSLQPEQQEAIEELNNIEANPYPWEIVDED